MKKNWLTVASFVLLLGLSACSGKQSATSTTTTSNQEVDKTTMNVELTIAPVGLHPLKTNDTASTFLTGQMYETLYKRAEDGTSFVPLLAADLPLYSEDGLKVTIPLREGVKFADGTPFTAKAVAYMIDCLKNKEYGSQRPSIIESIDSYEILDDTHIQLNLAYKDGVLVAKLAHTNGAIVNPELDKAQDLMVNPKGAGTGAYDFVSAVSGSHYVLQANENYWGGLAKVKTLNYDIVSDEATAVARLQTGEADFYPTVSVDSFATVSSLAGVAAVSQTSSGICYFATRSNEATAVNPLMANREFRQAILQAIDTDTYVATVMGEQASNLHSIVAPSLVGYTSAMEDSYETVAYNPEAAKKAIEKNGWTGQEVTMLVSTREMHQTLAAYVQQELAKVGITLKIESKEWATFLADAKSDKSFDLIILTWGNVTGDGQQALDPNFSTKNGLRVKYNNPEFDQLVEASARTTELQQRQANMLAAVEMIQKDAVVKPIYLQNALFAYNSRKFSKISMDMSTLFDVFKTELAQ